MPTLTICTTSFLPLAQLQFDTLTGGTPCAIAPISHPFGGITEEELSARIESAWKGLETWLAQVDVG
ncbi:hypothetical protein EPN42_05395 [bacterium]|nr:MAG: hypothetical protein EPN42_05395 [bacterium]